MKSLNDFFLFCSGTQTSLLKRTPSDTNKYVGIGATIFFTGIFAAIAASFAMFTVFKSYIIAIIVGLLWGLMIFNLDRFIVMSMKKKGGFFKEIVVATPRLLLAVLIAFVIAKPLELKLFQSEISSELVIMEQEVFKTQEDQLTARFAPSIDSLNSDIISLNTQIEEKREVRDALSLAAVQEADGTGGSMNRNLGPIYKAKKAEADNAQLELVNTEAELNPLIVLKRDQILTKETALNTALVDLKQSSLDGFAAQLDALGRLAQKSKTIWYASLFITLLFIAIETAPIFTKLISDRSPYDFKLDEHEHTFRSHHQTATTRLQTAVDYDITFDKETHKFRNQQTIGAEKEIITALVKEELEKVKGQPLSWASYIKKRNVFGSY